MADNNKKADRDEEGEIPPAFLRLLDLIRGRIISFKRNMTIWRDQFYQQLGQERDPHRQRLILWLIDKWNRLELEGIRRNEGVISKPWIRTYDSAL
jgi:hypothetical protein